MIISNKFKYVFISVPKTGTHTMYDVLQRHFSGKHYGAYHEHQIPHSAEDYYRFITVRNPYNRFASAWTHISRINEKYKQIYTKLLGCELELIPFLEWLVREKDNLLTFRDENNRLFQYSTVLMPIHLYIEKRLNNMHYDSYIQIEKINEQFHAKLPFVEVPINAPILYSVSKLPQYCSWENMKTPEVTRLVNAWAGKDFEMFGYHREA